MRAALMEALGTVEKQKGKKFLEHFIEQAFTNDRIAVSLAAKLVPDLKSIEGTLGVQPQTLADIAAIMRQRISGGGGDSH